MKIIIDGKEKKTCYAQVRDLYFLAARYKSSTFEQLYEKYINQGHAETDFVYLDDPRVVELINFNPFIVNFSEAVNYSQTALIRMAALTTGPVVHVDTEDNKHKRNDIFDIIDFKSSIYDEQNIKKQLIHYKSVVEDIYSKKQVNTYVIDIENNMVVEFK